MDSLLLAAPALIPLTLAFLVPIFERISHRIVAACCIVGMGAVLGVLLSLAPTVFGGRVLVVWMSDWIPRDGLAIGISLSVDAWGLLIALVVCVVGLAALFYSIPYMEAQTGKVPFYVLVMLLLAGLIGFSISGDFFNQFVWLEIFSVAAFALTGFHIENRTSVEAAFKYLITNSVATFFIAIALTLIYMQTGALNIAQAALAFRPTPAGLIAVGLLIGGYGTKAALIPWHFWLPDAHAAAPTPISALFSGALIKIGVYAVARTLFTLVPFQQGSVLQLMMLVIASLTMLVGGIQMLQQESIKRILAFSTVSQVGYIVLGVGLGTPFALTAAALHILHHALVKASLFMGAGLVISQADVHTIEEGGGLARRMPITFGAMIIGALSLSGLPFMSGYLSKTMLEEAAQAQHHEIASAVAVLASIFTFAGLARLLWRVFGTHGERTQRSEVREAPITSLLPVVVLVALSVIVGNALPWIVEQVAAPAAEALYNREHYLLSVMEPQMLSHIEEHEAHVELPPSPADISHWFVPAIILVAGTALTIALESERWWRAAWCKPFQWIGQVLRAWHSGYVTDYALWNAFGTAIVLTILIFVRWAR